MDDRSKSQSMISKEMKIIGSIESSGSLRIDGTLEGEMNCNGNAEIGKEAKIKGNIAANSVTIDGTVNGNIVAKDKIEMKASAKVSGDIKSKRLSVEDGVSFIGKSEVNPSGEPSSSSSDKGGESGSASTEDKSDQDRSKGFQNPMNRKR